MNNADTYRIAENITKSINDYGDGLSADFDIDGMGHAVIIRTSGKMIAKALVDSSGDVECSASRRRGLIFKLIRAAGVEF